MARALSIADSIFAAVPDDAGVEHQPIDVVRAERGDLLGLESGERLAVTGALPQDRRPGETGLGALERQQLEQVPPIARRHAPLDDRGARG